MNIFLKILGIPLKFGKKHGPFKKHKKLIYYSMIFIKVHFISIIRRLKNGKNVKDK